MKKIILFVFLIIISSCQTSYQNITIDIGDSKTGPEEPAILINPKNKNEVIAASNIKNIYHSNDGGVTWVKSKQNSSLGVFGDPILISDTLGNAYHLHLSNPSGNGWTDEDILDRIVIQKSEDFGHSWDDGLSIGHNPPKDQDKQWAHCNPFTNTIHVAWTEFDKYGSENIEHKSRILYSFYNETNQWSSPLQLNKKEGGCIDDNFTTEGTSITTDLNNNTHVIWSYDDSLYINSSQNKTFKNKERGLFKISPGWNLEVPGIYRCNGMPIIKTDYSDSEYKGQMYICWSDQTNGKDNTDIFISKSKDQGKTWSNPILVNNDNTNTHQFLPSMDVDPKTGNIYIVFYDRRKDDNLETEVYLGVSKNGGKSFKNIRISNKSFSPNPKVFFGDYNQISVFDGMVRPIWTHYENDSLSIKTAIINF